MDKIRIDLAYIFDGTKRDSIMLQNLQMKDNDVFTTHDKLSITRLREEFSDNISIYDATLFLTMVVKNELIWNLIKATGNEFVIIANSDSIMNHEKAKDHFPLNEAFMDISRCIVYGKIIIAEKRLLVDSLKTNIIPFEQWATSTTILQIE